MNEPQATLEQPKLTFLQKCKTMRGQQIIVTITFLIAPLLLLFVFTYLPFFKMVQFRRLSLLGLPTPTAGHLP